MPTAAQMYDPRRMFKYLGRRAVISVPAETLLAAMFVPVVETTRLALGEIMPSGFQGVVPSCASTKAAAMTNTPNRVAPVTS